MRSETCVSSIDSTLCFFPKDIRIYHIIWILEDHHMTAETFAWAVHDLDGLFVFTECAEWRKTVTVAQNQSRSRTTFQFISAKLLITKVHNVGDDFESFWIRPAVPQSKKTSTMSLMALAALWTWRRKWCGMTVPPFVPWIWSEISSLLSLDSIPR